MTKYEINRVIFSVIYALIVGCPNILYRVTCLLFQSMSSDVPDLIASVNKPEATALDAFNNRSIDHPIHLLSRAFHLLTLVRETLMRGLGGRGPRKVT